VAQFAAADFGPDPNELPAPFDPRLDYEREGTSIAVQYGDGLSYRIRSGRGIHESVWLNAQEVVKATSTRGWNVPGVLKDSARHESAEMAYIVALRTRMTAATMVRFDADNLRAPGQLIPEAKGIAFMDERGTGLASVYDAIINRDSESFTQIQSEVRIVSNNAQSQTWGSSK